MKPLIFRTQDHWTVVRHTGDKSLRRLRKLLWGEHNGPPPAGLYVVRVCDSHWCVKPGHCQLMTLSQAAKWSHRRRTYHYGPRKRLTRHWTDRLADQREVMVGEVAVNPAATEPQPADETAPSAIPSK